MTRGRRAAAVAVLLLVAIALGGAAVWQVTALNEDVAELEALLRRDRSS